MQIILYIAALAATGLLALLLSSFFVHRSIALLCRYGFAAEMGARHIHKRVIPTAGGIGMILAFLISCCIFYACTFWISAWSHARLELTYFLPVVLLFLIGVYDDRWGMRPVVKLFGQIIASFLAWVLGLRFDAFFGIPIPEIFSCGITVFWFVFFINAFNLIDGLDGLAAGLAVLAGISLGVVLLIGHDLRDAVVAFALVGVCLGFLRYNFHPARVFMGDTGSMFLGYMLAALGVVSSSGGTSFFAMIIPILACGVPLIDTMLAVWRRATFKILSKRSWREIMSADRSHLHHRILDAKASQSKTAITIYMLSGLLIVVGAIATLISQTLPMLSVILILFTLVLILRKFAVIEVWNSTQIIFRGLSLPRKSVLVDTLHPAYDLLAIETSFLLAIWLTSCHTGKELFLQCIVSGLIILVVLAGFRSYRVFWMRAGVSDYLRLSYILTLGFLLTMAGYMIANQYFHHHWELQTLLVAYLFTLTLVLGERMLLAALRILLLQYYHDSEFNHVCTPTLLYGAGAQLSSYQHFSSFKIAAEGERVVGILDDDPALRNERVCGYNILGDIDSLEAVYAKYKITKIVVIVRALKESKLARLSKFCREHHVQLVFFQMLEGTEPLMVKADEPEPTEEAEE